MTRLPRLLMLATLLLTAHGLHTTAAAQPAPGWSTPFPVSVPRDYSYVNNDFFKTVVDAAGNVTTTWVTQCGTDSCLVAARLAAGAGRWSPRVVVGIVSSAMMNAEVELDAVGNVFAAFRGYTTEVVNGVPRNRGTVLVARFRVATGAWDTPVEVSRSDTSSEFSLGVGSDGSAIILFTGVNYTGDPPEIPDRLRGKRFDPATGQWSSTFLVTDNSDDGRFYREVAVGADGRGVAVFSRANPGTLVLRRFDPASGVWSGEEVLTTTARNGSRNTPVVHVDDQGNVLVFYSTHANAESGQLLYIVTGKRYSATSETWSAMPVFNPVAVPKVLVAWRFAVTRSGEAVVTVTYADNGNGGRIVLQASVFRSGQWQSPVELTGTPFNVMGHEVALDGDGRVVLAAYTRDEASGSSGKVLSATLSMASGAWSSLTEVASESADLRWQVMSNPKIGAGPGRVVVTYVQLERIGLTDTFITRVRGVISPAIDYAPAITTAPEGRVVTAGTTATLTGDAAGDPVPSYQWQRSTDGGTSWSDVAATAPYSGVATATLMITSTPVTLDGTRFRLVATNRAGSATSTPATFGVRGAVSAAPAAVTFGATRSGSGLSAAPAPQDVTVSFAGTASTWSAAASVPWLTVTNRTGSGPGRFTIAVGTLTAAQVGQSQLTASVFVSASTTPNGSISIPITVNIRDASSSASPIGQMDTPAQNATGVQGAIAVTGWALDDVGVQSVKIYRNCLSLDPSLVCQTVLGQSVVYIGDAVFLAGARPDVESEFSTYPMAHRAGWGFLLLTSMLPHVTNGQSYGGQGPLTIYAVATDAEGNARLLGRSSDPQSVDYAAPTAITMTNDAVAKPFGAIDTPGQGETVSGVLNNFGWALTPDTNTTGGESGDILIPTTGGTMTVFIDSLPVAQVAYNQCRGNVGNPVAAGVFCNDDVANIFGNATPQAALATRTSNATRYRNLDAGRAAIGVYSFNTATLSNGLHTIAWSVTDSAGRTEGIGSRFFNVLNGGTRPESDAALRDAPAHVLGRTAAIEARPAGTRGVWARIGFAGWATWRALDPGWDEVYRVNLDAMSRMELWLGVEVTAGYLVTGDTLRPLPPGATLNGPQVAWVPPAGYVGPYRLAFLRGGERVDVVVTVR